MLEDTEGFDYKAGQDSFICKFHWIVKNKAILKYHGKQEL